MDLPSASLGIALLIQLVAVQMHLDINDFWTRDAFEAKMHQLMDRVAAGIDPDIPTLVAFPEDVGLLLVAQGMEAHLKKKQTRSTRHWKRPSKRSCCPRQKSNH